jgi:hypothetical protein
MTVFIIGIVIGVFIGWNIPEPEFAKTIKKKFKGE